MLKEYVAVLRNHLNRLYSNSDSNFVAIHGIQRSGTNYLSLALKDLGIYPLNEYCRSRKHPTHKHFRWQSQKDTIVMDRKFKNTLRVSTLDEVNHACRYPVGAVHLVIYKPLSQWIPSILNWGLRSGWWDTESITSESVRLCVDEYAAYYEFWLLRQLEHSDKVIVLALDDLVHDPKALIDVLEGAFVGVSPSKASKFSGKFSSVPQSPVDRSRNLSCFTKIDVDRLIQDSLAGSESLDFLVQQNFKLI